VSTSRGEVQADPEQVSPQALGDALALLFAGLHAAGDHLQRADPPSGSSRPAVAATRASNQQNPEEEIEMAFDRICGREVDQDRWRPRCADSTFWFCSPACRDQFQRAPRMLVALGSKVAAYPQPQRPAGPDRPAAVP
jgi:YHS domain-containing protein